MNREEIIRRARLSCQVCKEEKPTTRYRAVPNERYQGPCGDSFCYVSCSIPNCKEREFRIFSCDECYEKVK